MEMEPPRQFLKSEPEQLPEPYKMPAEASLATQYGPLEPGYLRLQDRADLAACRLQLWQAVKAMMTFHSKEAARSALASELKAIQEYLS